MLRNCNHFSDALVERLTRRRIPAWCNRLAYMGSWVSCILPQSMGVAHPESNHVQSRSAYAAIYSRSGAASFQPFAGQGLCLAQEMMDKPASRRSVGGEAAEAAGPCGIDRRTLLANAALARFQTMATESVPDVLGDATGGEGADRGKGRED